MEINCTALEYHLYSSIVSIVYGIFRNDSSIYMYMED